LHFSTLLDLQTSFFTWNNDCPAVTNILPDFMFVKQSIFGGIPTYPIAPHPLHKTLIRKGRFWYYNYADISPL
jgi:hypothetical protein